MEQIKTITRYNLWANKRMAEWLFSNDLSLLSKECPSSFSSISDTVQHILTAQVFYHSLISNSSFQYEKSPASEALLNDLVKQSDEMNNFVNDLDSAEMEMAREINAKFIKGHFKVSQLVQHCVNHSTYHRGAIVSMGRQLNLNKAPSTDMLFYFNDNSHTSP